MGGESAVDALWDSPHQEALWDHIWKWSASGESLIGGYASPEQDDPRGRKKKTLAKYEVQLLQLENDNFKHNWFIEPAALKRADFSRVLYHFACD